MRFQMIVVQKADNADILTCRVHGGDLGEGHKMVKLPKEAAHWSVTQIDEYMGAQVDACPIAAAEKELTRLRTAEADRAVREREEIRRAADEAALAKQRELEEARAKEAARV